MALRANRNKSSRKLLLIALLAVILAAAGYTTYAWQGDKWPFVDSVDTEQEGSTSLTDDNHEEGVIDYQESSKNKAGDADEENVVTPPRKTPKKYEGENPNSKNSLDGVINHLSVADNQVLIRVTIDQLASTGICKLKMTKGSKVVTKNAEIIQNPDSSSCRGFNVPVAELGSGTWSVNIKVESDDKTLNLTDTIKI